MTFHGCRITMVLHFSLSSQKEDAYMQRVNLLKMVLCAKALVDCYKGDHEFLIRALLKIIQQPLRYVGQWACFLKLPLYPFHHTLPIPATFTFSWTFQITCCEFDFPLNKYLYSIWWVFFPYSLIMMNTSWNSLMYSLFNIIQTFCQQIILGL